MILQSVCKSGVMKLCWKGGEIVCNVNKKEQIEAIRRY